MKSIGFRVPRFEVQRFLQLVRFVHHVHCGPPIPPIRTGGRYQTAWDSIASRPPVLWFSRSLVLPFSDPELSMNNVREVAASVRDKRGRYPTPNPEPENSCLLSPEFPNLK